MLIIIDTFIILPCLGNILMLMCSNLASYFGIKVVFLLLSVHCFGTKASAKYYKHKHIQTDFSHFLL